jgi:hypothetical protein
MRQGSRTGGAGTAPGITGRDGGAPMGGTSGTPGRAPLPLAPKLAARERAERASRDVAVCSTGAAGGVSAVPDRQWAKDLRVGRRQVYGGALRWIDWQAEHDVPDALILAVGEIVLAYAQERVQERGQAQGGGLAVRRATAGERARGVVAHISPPDPDPTPAAPARRAA